MENYKRIIWWLVGCLFVLFLSDSLYIEVLLSFHATKIILKSLEITMSENSFLILYFGKQEPWMLK